MRIISGKFRGTVLASVGDGDSAAHLRPTSDKVRGAIFNLLAHGDYPPIAGALVLDLFAGTGALGFEALSRGAKSVCFVDNGVRAAALIGENAKKLRVATETTLIRGDATRLGACATARFDMIFLDPPYGKGLGEAALTSAFAGGWIAAGALVVWEEAARTDVSLAGLRLRDGRSYGDTRVHFFTA